MTNDKPNGIAKKPTKEEIRLSNLPEGELKMREAAAVASSIITLVAEQAKPGVTLNHLEMVGAKLFKQMKARPYNYKYKPNWASTPYPAVMCLSVNNTIAHGIPSEYPLQEGDVLNIDTGVKFNGVCGDCAMTIPIGKISTEDERLLEKARKACYIGIQQVKAGARVVEISKAIHSYAKAVGYVTNTIFSGHDIAEEMHGTGLVIPNFYSTDKKYLMHFGGKTLKAGQVICIEPMLTKKDPQGRPVGDGWGLVTRDGSNSAMFEHMVLVKDDGYEVLTDHFDRI